MAHPKLIVGLGNAKPAYDHTRHNIGREFIDFLRDRANVSYSQNRQAEHFRLAVFFGAPLPRPVKFLKLFSFMNTSGVPVQALAAKDGVLPSEILVIADDFSIPYGSLRLRKKGSAGGHNGLKSLIEKLGTEEFPRLRVGIGPAPENEDPADWVLHKFSKKELDQRIDLFAKMEDGLKVLFQDGFEKAMNFLNKNHFEN